MNSKPAASDSIVQNFDKNGVGTADPAQLKPDPFAGGDGDSMKVRSTSPNYPSTDEDGLQYTLLLASSMPHPDEPPPPHSQRYNTEEPVKLGSESTQSSEATRPDAPATEKRSRVDSTFDPSTVELPSDEDMKVDNDNVDALLRWQLEIWNEVDAKQPSDLGAYILANLVDPNACDRFWERHNQLIMPALQSALCDRMPPCVLRADESESGDTVSLTAAPDLATGYITRATKAGETFLSAELDMLEAISVGDGGLEPLDVAPGATNAKKMVVHCMFVWYEWFYANDQPNSETLNRALDETLERCNNAPDLCSGHHNLSDLLDRCSL